jgi:glycosyltransferase involved in cell wall biosynthesis
LCGRNNIKRIGGSGMKVVIATYRLKNFYGEGQCAGGMETYLLSLAKVCQGLGMHPVFYQCAAKEFKSEINGIEVVGVKTPDLKHTHKTRVALAKRSFSEIDTTKDIFVFGGVHWTVPTSYPRTISIQHGVGWDLPAQFNTRLNILRSGLGEQLHRLNARRMALKFFCNCRNRVCVDYNFYNWYKTYFTIQPNEKIWVIPNSATPVDRERVQQKWAGQSEKIKILFARRFEEYRGSRLMAAAVKQLLRKHSNIEFTFAGDGTDKQWLLSEFKGEPRVIMTSYLSHESQEFHLAYDISIAPSLGSEGTTLSVVEAMAAGCAVVASSIGGVTNQILSGFNGIMILPTVENIVDTLDLLIKNKDFRLQISKYGYETACNAFSTSRWETSWKEVLSSVMKIK